MSISGSYDPMLVVISILIAITASYAALDLAARARVAVSGGRQGWLVAAAVVMGGGIWAMHFVAMLAFYMPGVAVSYDVRLTLVSLCVAVAATGAGFALVSRPATSWLLLLGAGVLMGLGVAAMHYLGMLGMRMGAVLHYDRAWVAASLAIAVIAATAALWLTGRSGGAGRRGAAAVTMGIAISGMHFTGMHAATFEMTGQVAGGDLGSGFGQAALAMAVAVAAFLILALALVAAMVDRRLAQLAARETVALRSSEERFRSLYDGTPLALHSLDELGRIEHVSRIWLDLLGYARADVIGRPLINFLTEASARAMRQGDWPQLLAEGNLQQRDYKAVTRDGRFLDVECAHRVLRDEDGRFLRVLGGLTDVTERRRTEEALRQSQKIEAIGQLTGGIAHDFNNLLSVVIGNLDLLRRRAKDDERALRLIDNALKGADRGAALTQRLLAFARRQDLRPAPVDVPQLVLGMSDLLQRSLGPMVRIETRFPLDLPPAMADAHQLELALLNLGVNARDAMPDGGALVIAAEQERVAAADAGGLQPGAYLKLTLADTGAGMDGDTLSRATEPFYTTKPKGQGTGLGLSMVQGLAAQSGGRLALRSEIGCGTIVEIWLPAAANIAKAEPVTHARPVPGEGRSRHVLAVDDDALVLANTVAMLEDLGHRVVHAGSGAEALERLREDHTIDLVVSDQLMPGMTGTQLRDRMRDLALDRPFLLVSGFADLGGLPMPDVPLLRKPFARAALAEAMAALPDPAFSGSVVSIKAARR